MLRKNRDVPERLEQKALIWENNAFMTNNSSPVNDGQITLYRCCRPGIKGDSQSVTINDVRKLLIVG